MNTNTSNLRTVILKPGETFVLPRGAVVRSVIANGAIDVESSCDNLPDISFYKCWRFVWERVDTIFDDAYFTSIEIGGVQYSLTTAGSLSEPRQIILGDSVADSNRYNNGGVYLPKAIPQVTPTGLVSDITTRGGEAVNPKCITLKIPDTMGAPKIYWTNPTLGSSNQYAIMVPEENECACPA